MQILNILWNKERACQGFLCSEYPCKKVISAIVMSYLGINQPYDIATNLLESFMRLGIQKLII